MIKSFEESFERLYSSIGEFPVLNGAIQVRQDQVFDLVDRLHYALYKEYLVSSKVMYFANVCFDEHVVYANLKDAEGVCCTGFILDHHNFKNLYKFEISN